MLFIGPSLLSGIGQVVQKYQNVIGGRYVNLGDSIPEGEDVFLFALPIQPWINWIPYYKSRAKRLICMTICETETVHPDYGKLFDLVDTWAVSSDFCKEVFSRQFPNTTFRVIPCYAPAPLKLTRPPSTTPYIFYHIGNIVDPRKNVKQILEAFMRLNLPDSQLVLKATCNREVTWKLPGVTVINGLKSDEYMQSLHDSCHCYVSFSSSEGVGMGAVEAALNNRPVIFPEYGGCKEYVKTPYLIACDLQEILQDDFLFQKGMVWGKPRFEQLMEYMRDAYEKRVVFHDHSWTKEFVSAKNIKNLFL